MTISLVEKRAGLFQESDGNHLTVKVDTLGILVHTKEDGNADQSMLILASPAA
jgi:hypothetical protein